MWTRCRVGPLAGLVFADAILCTAGHLVAINGGKHPQKLTLHVSYRFWDTWLTYEQVQNFKKRRDEKKRLWAKTDWLDNRWSAMVDGLQIVVRANKGMNLSCTLRCTFVGGLEHYDCLLGWLGSLQYILTYVWFSVKVGRPGRYSSGMSDMLWSAAGPNKGVNLSYALSYTFVGDLEHYECLLGWMGPLQ